MDLACAGSPALHAVQRLTTREWCGTVIRVDLAFRSGETDFFPHLSLFGEGGEEVWSYFHLTLGEVEEAAMIRLLQNALPLLNRLDKYLHDI